MGGDADDDCLGRALCTTAGTSCDADMLVVCAEDAIGCLVETRTGCGTGEACDATSGTAACVDVCTMLPAASRCTTDGERSCTSNTLSVCAANADGCLVITDTDCSASPGGVCDTSGAMPMCVPLPTCGDVDARLRDDFGIIIDGGTRATEEDIGCADRIKIYQMFRLPFAYVQYPVRLNPSVPVTLQLYRSASPRAGYCGGYAPSSRAIQLTDLSQCLAVVSGPTDRDFIPYAQFLIHEFGHIISARNSSLLTSFRAEGLPARDPGCYDGSFLKTYPLRSGVVASNESFAEAIALFIGNARRTSTGTITNFRDQCPNTYAWVRDTIYGDHR